MTKKSKMALIISLTGTVFLLGFIMLSFQTQSNPGNSPAPTPTLSPINVIPLSERPYVSLAPLTARNELEFTVDNLTKKADEVEVTLEYDRNKGVWDAVLKNFFLKNIPYKDNIFLGSKSDGGHITYHEDVIGGKLILRFSGPDRYALEVPWRYSDTQKEYAEISTQDAKFQAVFVKPLKTPKLVVMQSPGLPSQLERTVIAGPYLIRGVGDLPETQANLTIRLTEEAPEAKLFGWDGTNWQPIEATVSGKTLTAFSPMYLSWVVGK